MSKHRHHSGRSELPPGWQWADWSGRGDVELSWAAFDEKVRQRLRHRFMEITAAREAGKLLPREKVRFDRGISKAKIVKPNPGWRAWFFRDGPDYFVTHITKKANDHDVQIATALAARHEHLKKRNRS